MTKLADVFNSSSFMPHGHCYLWSDGLIGLHTVSDALIVLAYFSIPFTLVYFVRRRRDVEFHWMFVCFAVFIMACGTTHLMEIWNIWHASYWLSGSIKAVTAMASVPTAILLVKLVPQALALPSGAQLNAVNSALQIEIVERKQAEARLHELNEKLEARVAERTAELDRSHEALRVSEERFRMVVEAAPNAMVVADEKGRIILVNLQLELLFGYARTELLDQPVELLVPERYRGANPEQRGGFFEQAMGVGHDLFGRRKDGSEVPIEVGLSPVRAAEGPCVLASIVDITERKAAEETIRLLNADLEQRVRERTMQFESANRELEAFSYSVSHDLRAPLRAIDGFSQAVLTDFGPQLPAEGQRYLRTIRYSAQQMGALIDDLLTFARLNREEINKQSINTLTLVRGTLDDLGFPWGNRKVEIRTGELPVSSGDPVLLKQVWLNLLSNALKYTGKREKAEVEIGSVKTEGIDTFFIRDNGTGFDMRYAGKLFGVFQRMHRAEDYEGTGVGLAIVQRIIQRHGGRVWAEAAPDRGATFYFTLEKETK